MYLVSSCLAGINCRYNGTSSENEFIIELLKKGEALPICPEQLAGLPIPRPCCEIVKSDSGETRVVSCDGVDFTNAFLEGAARTLRIAKAADVKVAILKANSPSCGRGFIYDGSFSGNLIVGNGLTADILLKNGIRILTEKDIIGQID